MKKQNSKFLKIEIWSLFVIWCLVFGICVSGVCAETVTYQSPTIWRADEEGDYQLPKIKNLPVVLESKETIETSGAVTSITASWKFTGEVTLEISLDAGRNYISAVNGVPLDFTQYSILNTHDKIKWRANIGKDSKLEHVEVSYTDAGGVTGSFGEPALSGFKYRKEIKIGNPNEKDLFNYQFLIEAGESESVLEADFHCDGNINGAFSDIRWTCADGQTLLPYYIEEIKDLAPSRRALVWVKLAQIPASGAEIYVYYGNKDAVDLSNPKDVFDFYDDFSGENLDTSLWNIQVNKDGVCKLEDGQLKLNNAKVISRDYVMAGGIIEYAAQAVAGGEVRAVIHEDKQGLDSTQRVSASVYEGSQHAVVIGDTAKVNTVLPIKLYAVYSYRVEVNAGGDIRFSRWPLNYSAEKDAEVIYLKAQGLAKGSIGLEVGGTGERTALYNWVRARKYVKEDLTVKAQAAQKVSLPYFSDTLIDKKGNLVLGANSAGYVDSGIYLTAPQTAKCEIRKVSCGWDAVSAKKSKRDPITVDFSSDNGENWLAGCEREKVYFSGKDFKAGSVLNFRVNFKPEIAAGLEKLSLTYDSAPVVTAANIKCSGMSNGKNYLKGDTITVEWDNSETGDNNSDIESVFCDFSKFGGKKAPQIFDDGKAPDKSAQDNIYTAGYKLPDGLNINSDIYVSAINSCGEAAKAGKIISVNTASELEKPAEETIIEEEITEEEIDLDALFSSERKPGSKLYDVLIKLRERAGADTEGRFRRGDILMIKPHGFEWSETEKKSYLILQFYLTEEETVILTTPEEAITDETDESGAPVKRIIKQRKYKIDLDKVGLTQGVLENPKKLESIKGKIERRPVEKTVVEEKEAGNE